MLSNPHSFAISVIDRAVISSFSARVTLKKVKCSGNSIPYYVPDEGYLAMISAVR